MRSHSDSNPDDALCSCVRDSTDAPDREASARRIDRLLAEAPASDGAVQALIVPAAADESAEPASAAAWAVVRGRRLRRVVLLAGGGERPATVLDAPRLEIAEGHSPIDLGASRLLASYPDIGSTIEANPAGLRAALRFVQRLWPQVPVVAVLVGPAEPEQLEAAGRVLRNVLDEDTLVVACAGTLHPQPGATSVGYDGAAPVVAALLERDPVAATRLRSGTAPAPCGLGALEVMLHALGPGAAGRLTGQLATAAEGAAHFGALFPGRFPAVPELDDEDRMTLGAIAEDAVAAAVLGRDPRPLPLLSPRLAQPGGAFVSLHLRGALKGCIGRLIADQLGEAVAIAGRMAAQSDPRFHPLRPDELAAVDLEVSVLGPFIEIEGPQDFEPGRHGLVLTCGYDRGLLLPQVATQYGMGREAFLQCLAQKAGLEPGAWKRAKIQRFGAQVFSPRPVAG